jgi:hypothetical protein
MTTRIAMRDETRFIPTSREFALFALFHTFIVLGQDSFVKELRSLSPLHDTRVINDLSVLGASFLAGSRASKHDHFDHSHGRLDRNR